jgi:protein translocase SecG subunit
MIYLKGFLIFVQGVISLVLILLVMTQTSKNEGFGTIGVQTPTNFKGKPGFEERMHTYTRNLAIAWMALGIVVAFVANHT